MKIGLSIIITGVLILASCSQGQKRAEYLVKIDSLSGVLKNDLSEYNKSIDSELISFYLKNMDSQLIVLDSLDSLSIIPENFDYSELRQSFNLFLEENPQISEEASICQSQLTNLRFDAENKLINNDQLHTYFEQESNAVSSLQNKMELFQKRIKSQTKNYELLNSKIKYWLDSLSQN